MPGMLAESGDRQVFCQVSIAITPAHSGSHIVDFSGKVISVIVSKVRQQEAISGSSLDAPLSPTTKVESGFAEKELRG